MSICSSQLVQKFEVGVESWPPPVDYFRVWNSSRRNDHSPRPALVALMRVFHVHLTNVPSTVEIRAVQFIMPT